jgi:hypothetical protein
MKKTKIQDLLSQSQLLKAIDKGLKSYENLLSAEVLENNKYYISLCELITKYEFNNTVCENFDKIQKQYKKFVDSL